MMVFKQVRKSIFALSIVLLLLPGCFERYNIHEVKNLDLLKKEIPTLDEHSLVIFDVDNTLLVHKSRVWSMEHNKKARDVWMPWHEKFKKGMQTSKSSKEKGYLYFFSRMWMNAEQELIDTTVISLLERIKASGAKIIALTSVNSGECGVIKNPEAFRFQELKQQGIDFSFSFPDQERIPLTVQNRHPVFYKGVLCADWVLKGEVLAAFLKKISWQPKKIIFLDDEYKHVKSVAAFAKQKGIDFLGLHYRATVDLPCDVDPELAEFMVKHLINHEEWLPVEEARKLLGR